MRTSGWLKKSKEEIREIFQFCEAYKEFLNKAKTEREAVTYLRDLLVSSGFAEGKAGDKFFKVNRGKELIAFRKGVEEVSSGLNIVVAHIDAPRLDLKQNPLYEDVDLALLRTHYYGGIKKYQWVTIPLAIHGTVAKTDGRRVQIVLGEDPSDPVFSIDDLLPHLSRKAQDEKKVSEAIEGEKLVVLFGSIPLHGEEKEAVKKGVLKLLFENYGIAEEDFVSAEIEVVPAFKAQDVGIDRSMIGAYGQDDRACAYPLIRAFLETESPKRSCLAIFCDKEEIGSEGNTGMKSNFLKLFLYELLETFGVPPQDFSLEKMLFDSKAISADVNGAMNPAFQDVHERQNACFLGHGVCVSKYTGHGGKIGASDAHAEYVAHIRNLFDRAKVIWQAAELGKVDEGGGGTVAKYLAVHGVEIIDCGVPLLAMHSPFEISSKLDVFETFRAFKVFFES